MSFAWIKYLDLAQEMMNSGSPVPEAKLRSAISRAYYAAFHQAKFYLEQQEGAIYRRDNVHDYVASRFLEMNHKQKRICNQISDDLDLLRRDRNKADYDSNFAGGLKEIRNKAVNALTVAKRIMSNLDRL